MEKIILIKYGELTTKKSNRNQFIKKLNNNILKQINDLNLEIKYDQSRMFIYVSEAHLDEVVERLNKVFGIHGIVICHPVDNNIESIKEKTLEILKNEKFNTFGICPITSCQEWNQIFFLPFLFPDPFWSMPLVK